MQHAVADARVRQITVATEGKTERRSCRLTLASARLFPADLGVTAPVLSAFEKTPPTSVVCTMQRERSMILVRWTLVIVASNALACAGAFAADAKEVSWPRSWYEREAPVHVYGNTYYIGTRGLSAVLIVSSEGHVVIDGTVPEAASDLLANVRGLGFDTRDIKYVLNSHAHFDHSGGIAAIQEASGATVLSSPAGAAALSKGRGGPDDPQYTVITPFPAVANTKVLPDRGSIEIGSTKITVHYTPGHTPGGTSWTWRSCERERCLDVVYADSLNAVSADDFRYSGDPRYPNAAADLRASIDRIEKLSCDIVISAHPEGSGFWEKVERRKNGEANALTDPNGCRAYAQGARERLNARLERERARE